MNPRFTIYDLRLSRAGGGLGRAAVRQSSIADRKSNISAFTLLEVLVALMIFALTAVVLGSAYVNVLYSYQVAARANQTHEDVAFARSQLLAEPDRKVVEEGGDFESTNNRRVKWTATIASTSINDLFTVTFVCEIADPAKAEPDKITETFTVLRPTWSDPAERGQLLIDIKARIAEIQGKARQ
jgi:general secretion pathway protein I